MEALSRDLTDKVLALLQHKRLMYLDYDDFDKIAAECRKLFRYVCGLLPLYCCASYVCQYGVVVAVCGCGVVCNDVMVCSGVVTSRGVR